jgi:hypothetical protein
VAFSCPICSHINFKDVVVPRGERYYRLCSPDKDSAVVRRATVEWVAAAAVVAGSGQTALQRPISIAGRRCIEGGAYETASRDGDLVQQTIRYFLVANGALRGSPGEAAQDAGLIVVM